MTKTVGSILKSARIEKKYSLEQVELATRIRKNFLNAIEQDNYSQLPSLSYAKGFVKNYSQFLGLNVDTMLAYYRRQNKDITKSSLLPKGVSEPLNSSLIQMTPGRFLTISLISVILIFVIYFTMQYQRLSQPPKLIIDTPKDNLVTTSPRIDILGHTDSDATVSINGVNILVRSDGKFFDQVNLSPGQNQITITATSRYGKNTTIRKNVSNKP